MNLQLHVKVQGTLYPLGTLFVFIYSDHFVWSSLERSSKLHSNETLRNILTSPPSMLPSPNILTTQASLSQSTPQSTLLHPSMLPSPDTIATLTSSNVTNTQNTPAATFHSLVHSYSKSCLPTKVFKSRRNLRYDTANKDVLDRMKRSSPDEVVIRNLATDIGIRAGKITARKYDASVLMKKDFDDLLALEMSDIVDDLRQNFPELYHILVCIMLRPEKVNDIESLGSIIPRLAMIYSIALNTRNMELSRLQRIIAMCLLDNVSDQKV